MHLVKDVEAISLADREQAMNVMNKLRAGNRVFGKPAKGLKKTLARLEQKLNELNASMDKLDWSVNDGEIRSEISMIKAGISGEEKLAEYLERVVKYDPKLEDIVFFASLSDPEQDSGNGEYISDSDFVAVNGRNIMIIDAKNFRTNPEIPLYLDGNMLLAAGGKEVLELHPSTYIWSKIFEKKGITMDTIHGCVVIVNDSGATIWKNKDWHKSEVKPMHISELVNFLHKWTTGTDGTQNLSVLTAMANMQIRKKGTDLDLSAARRMFKI